MNKVCLTCPQEVFFAPNNIKQCNLVQNKNASFINIYIYIYIYIYNKIIWKHFIEWWLFDSVFSIVFFSSVLRPCSFSVDEMITSVVFCLQIYCTKQHLHIWTFVHMRFVMMRTVCKGNQLTLELPWPPTGRHMFQGDEDSISREKTTPFWLANGMEYLWRIHMTLLLGKMLRR